MSGPRFLALFLTACVLLASALVAIPLDSAIYQPASAASISDDDTVRLTGTIAKSAPTPAATESEAETPRLWLGAR